MWRVELDTPRDFRPCWCSETGGRLGDTDLNDIRRILVGNCGQCLEFDLVDLAFQWNEPGEVEQWHGQDVRLVGLRIWFHCDLLGQIPELLWRLGVVPGINSVAPIVFPVSLHVSCPIRLILAANSHVRGSDRPVHPTPCLGLCGSRHGKLWLPAS